MKGLVAVPAAFLLALSILAGPVEGEHKRWSGWEYVKRQKYYLRHKHVKGTTPCDWRRKNWLDRTLPYAKNEPRSVCIPREHD